MRNLHGQLLLACLVACFVMAIEGCTNRRELAPVLLKFPEFPWPPPEASASAVIPAQSLANPKSVTTFDDVNRRLVGALESTGYLERSYFAVPGGFALATRMEQIKASGEPEDAAHRWILERQPLQKFELSAYLAALFKASPGRYRVIVFIATPHPFSQSDDSVTSSDATDWMREGVDQLPVEVGQRHFDNPKCTALIYEFTRTTDVTAPELSNH